MAPSFAVADRFGPPGALGRVVTAGRVVGGRGVPGSRPRSIPTYAVMLVYAGDGRYRDRHGERPLGAGSLVVLVPGHSHWYGVLREGTWSEVYLTFAGPVFDLAARTGLIDRRRPVGRALPVEHWRARIDAFRTRPAPTTRQGTDREVCELLALLVDARSPGPGVGPRPDWLADSQARLSADLAEPLSFEEVAVAVGMGYESWRKRFRARTGMSPGRFRAARRVDAAAEALRRSTLSHTEIAASLGFSDAHHLAKRFRALRGVTPTEFRRR